MSRISKEEATFLASREKRGPGRPKGVLNISRNARARELITKYSTIEFFRHIMNDDMERRLWMAFISGKDENGEPIELNPISFKAFLRCVEYKRGMPVVTVEATDDKTVKVEFNVVGANKEFFEQQAKASGILPSPEPKILEAVPQHGEPDRLQ